jgi:hypothetical protein
MSLTNGTGTVKEELSLENLDVLRMVVRFGCGYEYEKSKEKISLFEKPSELVSPDGSTCEPYKPTDEGAQDKTEGHNKHTIRKNICTSE